MISNILFVCIGNICRSPMAEGLFKQALPGKAVCSAGIHAMVGDAADPLSIQLMRENGIDINGHRAQSLAGWMIKESDLIVTMDCYQMRFIENKFAGAKGKVMRLGEHGKYDVPDPYRQNVSAFRHSFDLISQGIDELVERLAVTGKKESSYAASSLRESALPFSP